MPINIRKDDATKRIAIDILGIPKGGLTDSRGNKKRYSKKKVKKNEEEQSNRFEEIGYR